MLQKNKGSTIYLLKIHAFNFDKFLNFSDIVLEFLKISSILVLVSYKQVSYKKTCIIPRAKVIISKESPHLHLADVTHRLSHKKV